MIALLKRNNQNITTLNTTASAPIPTQAVTVPIGGVGIPSGGVASGAYASGSIASGAFASGSFAAVAATKAASTPAAATDIAMVVDQRPGSTTAISAASLPLPAGAATAANQGLSYPVGATAITASATGTTAATTATLAGTTGKTTYICSYSIRANATAVTTVLNTVTGVITATLSHQMWVPANTAGLGIDEQIFPLCVPASATNTGIAVVSGAPGTGDLVSVTATGYQL